MSEVRAVSVDQDADLSSLHTLHFFLLTFQVLRCAEKKREDSRAKQGRDRRETTDPTLLLVREKGKKLVGKSFFLQFPPRNLQSICITYKTVKQVQAMILYMQHMTTAEGQSGLEY